jgi:uncharacterized lipoprotein YddW (UPF0748 family)
MKKLILFFILIATIIFFCFLLEKEDRSKTTPEATTVSFSTQKTENKGNKIYAVWLTYSEIGSFVKNKTESEYRKSLEALFENLKENKINTVFYQCRAFCDSFYNSDIFPVSKYITANSNIPAFDPFEIFLEKAEKYNISVHCWINPYRISYDADFKNLPKNSPARKLYKADENTLIVCKEGIFLNPATDEARALVLSGIREILKKYRVDGIHFDDYFYPETKEINDDELYKEYKKQGGKLSLAEWRRENVNVLVSSVYSFVKSHNENMIFSISPSADIEKCKNVFFCDVEKWCREEGFVDLIIPQIYYGFENEEMAFEKVFKEWDDLCKNQNVKLLCGLAAYKCGREDKFAGKGKNEWTENVNILSTQYEQALVSPVWQGFSLFSYSYCFGDNVTEISKKEIKNLLYMVE